MFRGGRVAWNPCPFDYEFYASAVDEHGKRDGTPAGLPFYVSGAPALDTVEAPRVFVLVPACVPNTPIPCPAVPVFGADTVAVQGIWVGGGGAPLALGSNRFTLPVRVTGHDSPLDRNGNSRFYYAAANEGAIRSWRYQFNCLGNCDDLVLPGEDQWTNDTAASGDPPGQQVFDGPLAFTVPLDTLCTTVPCTPGALQVVVRGAFFGTYEFAVEGRDSRPFQTCPEPSDLGPSPFVFTRPVEGRSTGIAGRRVELRALHQVRPGAQSSRRPRTRR